MTGKIKQSPKLPAEVRKEQLLDSARSLFVKKGFRMTTTDEIARNAGLTKGALYFHFKKKEDILFELIKTIWDKGDKNFKSDLKTPSHPTPFLEIMLNFHNACDLVDYWDMIDLWMQGIRIPRIKKYIGKRIMDAKAGQSELIDPKFGNKKQRQQLVTFVMAFCDGLSFMQHINPEGVDMKAQVKLFDRMVNSLIVNKKRTKK